jgi:protein involved in polysaccharide export with SLBB domain
MRLQGGDILYVPTLQQQVIYIIGEVRFPGAYILPRFYDHITAARALAYAGGTLRRTAKTGKVFIVRYDKNGAIKPIPFDVAATLKGEQPEIPVLPNDVIFVPRSAAKMTGYKLLDMVAHMTQQFLIF